jgi:hypothetical protein
LSRRELLDGAYEVLYKVTQPNGDLSIRHKDDAGKETETLVEKAAIEDRVRVDERPRKFNDVTAARIFSAIDEAEQRKNELGLSSPGLDSAFQHVRNMVRGEDARSFPDALRSNPDTRARTERACVEIATHILAQAEIRPRRLILRGRLKHMVLHAEAE